MGKFRRDSYRKLFKSRPKKKRSVGVDEIEAAWGPGSPYAFSVDAGTNIKAGEKGFGIARNDLGLYLNLCVLSISGPKLFPCGGVKQLVYCMITSANPLKGMKINVPETL